MSEEFLSVEPPPAGLTSYLVRNEKSLAWAFRIVGVLGWLFLTSHFLSREEYSKDQVERAKSDKELAVTLEKLNGTLNRYEDMHEALKDHELRLRYLETHPHP